MGADLNIEKDESEETGYFRDSYNETNIMWKLGLSYWQMEKEIPFIGKIGRVLKLKQVKILETEVEKRKGDLDVFLNQLTEEWLKEHHCVAGVEEWRKFWRERYDKLLVFLNHAIELKSGIRWSV